MNKIVVVVVVVVVRAVVVVVELLPLLRAMSRRDGQRGAVRSQEGWFCKNCDDGYCYFGWRRSCNKCGMDKGRCFAGKAAPASGTGPATNLAERQVARQKLESKQKHALATKQKTIDKLQKELLEARSTAASPAEGDNHGAMEADDKADM